MVVLGADHPKSKAVFFGLGQEWAAKDRVPAVLNLGVFRTQNSLQNL